MQSLLDNEKVRAGAYRLRYPVTILLLAVVLYFARAEWFWIGLTVSVVGELLQIWCFACLNKNVELTIRGPYLVVRNPMYLGRYLLVLGVVLLTASLWVVLLFTALYYVYMYYRVRREEVRLRANFDAPLERYYARVNRFLPSVGLFNISDFFYFDRTLFVKNNAHWNLLSAAAVYAAFYFYLFTMPRLV